MLSEHSTLQSKLLMLTERLKVWECVLVATVSCMCQVIESEGEGLEALGQLEIQRMKMLEEEFAAWSRGDIDPQGYLGSFSIYNCSGCYLDPRRMALTMCAGPEATATTQLMLHVRREVQSRSGGSQV